MSALITTTSTSGRESKGHAMVAYMLLAIGLFTAIPLLFGAIWAIIQKKSALGTQYHSHLVNATRVFWWSLFWTVIGAIFSGIGIGYLVWVAAWVWVLYRIADGFAKLISDQPYAL